MLTRIQRLCSVVAVCYVLLGILADAYPRHPFPFDYGVGFQTGQWSQPFLFDTRAEFQPDPHVIFRTTEQMTFLQACAAGDVAVVSGLLNRENLRARDSLQRTGLMLAAENGKCSLVELLMKQRDTEENARSNDNSTALILAAMKKRLDCVKHITDYPSVDVNAQRVDGSTSLHVAARNNDVEMAQHLLERGARVYGYNFEKELEAPLTIACKNNSTDVAIFLMKQGAYALEEVPWGPLNYAAKNNNVELLRRLLDIDDWKTGGWMERPLISAIKANSTDTALFLINRKADLDSVDRNAGVPAIFFAMEQNNLKVVGALVRQGANLNAIYLNARAVLTEAAYLGHCDIVRVLVPHTKLTLEHYCSNGRTAFLNAVDYNHPRCVKILAENGANVNAQRPRDGFSALHMAAFKNDFELAKLLVELGINVNLRAAERLGAETPILTAIKLNRPKVADYLADLSRVDIQVADISNGKVMPLLGLAATKDMENVVELLILRGAPLEERATEHDMTPLLLAAWYNCPNAAMVLLENGADVNAVTRRYDGKSALHYFAENNQYELVRRMLDAHAKTEVGDIETPLISACLASATESAELLLDNGAHVNVRRLGIGNTPLHYAAETGNLRIARRLVDLGAIINARNDNGQTPLNFAEAKGKGEMVAFLNSLQNRK